MWKEIKFGNQKGWGLAVTNPTTGSRALVGIFASYWEAYQCGLDRKANVKNPRVVKWNKRNYDKYDYVFEK